MPQVYTSIESAAQALEEVSLPHPAEEGLELSSPGKRERQDEGFWGGDLTGEGRRSRRVKRDHGEGRREGLAPVTEEGGDCATPERGILHTPGSVTSSAIALNGLTIGSGSRSAREAHDGGGKAEGGGRHNTAVRRLEEEAARSGTSLCSQCSLMKVDAWVGTIPRYGSLSRSVHWYDVCMADREEEEEAHHPRGPFPVELPLRPLGRAASSNMHAPLAPTDDFLSQASQLSDGVRPTSIPSGRVPRCD